MTARSAFWSKPILVAGGAGFLGRHLCRWLLELGYEVICVDNFCTSDASGLAEFSTNSRFELMVQDIENLNLEAIPPLGCIFNLACAASPPQYQRRPRATLFANLLGMDNLLRLAARHHVTLVQSSTSEIYGHPFAHPQLESHWGHVNTLGPRACYDEGKRCAETLCYIYSTHYGVDARIARIFNTYGPGMLMADGRVMINFIAQALKGSPLTVHGDGTQTRSFCYVADLIEGLLKLSQIPRRLSQPVNLGNPTEITVGELAMRVIKATGSRSTLRYGDLPTDDPPRRRPDISRAREVLGWEPSTGLDVGLRHTIADVRGRSRSLDGTDMPALDTHATLPRFAALDGRIP